MAADPKVVRVASKMIHGEDGGCVVIPARVCAWLWCYVLRDWQRTHPAVMHPEIAGVFLAIEVAASKLRIDVGASTKVDESLTTAEAGKVLRMSDRAVRKAIAAGRLPAELVAGRWKVYRGDVALFMRTRPRP